MEDETCYIYLDNNSTTPLDREVIRAIHATCQDFWANPSSSSYFGKKAKECIELSRRKVARCVNTSQENVIFTSGGTEGNNMVIQSAIKYGLNSFPGKPHVITSTVEHDATLQHVNHLLHENIIELTLIPMRKDGSMCGEDFLDAVKHNTCLISLMMANNETGVIFQLAQLASGLKKINARRKEIDLERVLLHTDAAQAIGKMPVDMMELNVDYITVVGHKFYGPRIGAVCRRDNSTPLTPLLYGGGQESNLRPGTENTPMIAGLGKACEIVTENLTKFQSHMRRVSEHLRAELQRTFGEKVVFNFDDVEKLANTLSVSFVGVSGRELLATCPRVVASTGSACHSSSSSTSRILLESLDESVARATVRLSVGRTTTIEEINTAVHLLKSAYLKLIST